MHRILSSAHKLQTAEQNQGCHFALRWHSYFNLCVLRFHCSSHIPDEKCVGDKKFNSNHQMFSTGGRGQLGMRLYMYLASLPGAGGGGGERAPDTHCLRMRIIIAKATWQN